MNEEEIDQIRKDSYDWGDDGLRITEESPCSKCSINDSFNEIKEINVYGSNELKIKTGISEVGFLSKRFSETRIYTYKLEGVYNSIQVFETKINEIVSIRIPVACAFCVNYKKIDMSKEISAQSALKVLSL